MDDQSKARWPFRVMAAVVAFLMFLGIAMMLRNLIVFREVKTLAEIAVVSYFSWRFWRIATTGSDPTLRSNVPENDT